MDFLPLLVRLQDEPIADNVCIPLYFLAKLVKDSGTTVVQVGEGADENFLGYWWCEHYRRLTSPCTARRAKATVVAPHPGRASRAAGVDAGEAWKYNSAPHAGRSCSGAARCAGGANSANG